MEISVVMSIYNESLEEVKESINSILNQSYSEFEFIIIIDNPNASNLIKIVKEFSLKDKRIKYIVNDKNIGLALSLNKGVKISTGIYIARMDADDISLKDRLKKQLDYLKENQDVVLLGSSAKIIDNNGIILGNLCQETSFKKIKRKMKFESCFIHPSVIFKKEVYEKIGGYRNFPCAQDYDFFSRIIDANHKVANLPDFLLLYRIRENNLTNTRRLLQILLSEYIHKLSKERKKNKRDFFSLEEIKKIEDLYEKEKNNFNKARDIIKKYNKNKILLYLNIPRIVFMSKYYLILVKNKINCTLIDLMF